MRELTLHLLDLAQNSLTAGATHLWLAIRLDEPRDLLSMEIRDNGRGMAPEMLAQVTDPFVTSRTTRHVGLGLPLLKAAVERCEGSFTIASDQGRGTTVRTVFRLSHVDRMPLGDLTGTIVSLIACNPELNLELRPAGTSPIFAFPPWNAGTCLVPTFPWLTHLSCRTCRSI